MASLSCPRVLVRRSLSRIPVSLLGQPAHPRACPRPRARPPLSPPHLPRLLSSHPRPGSAVRPASALDHHLPEGTLTDEAPPELRGASSMALPTPQYALAVGETVVVGSKTDDDKRYTIERCVPFAAGSSSPLSGFHTSLTLSHTRGASTAWTPTPTRARAWLGVSSARRLPSTCARASTSATSSATSESALSLASPLPHTSLFAKRRPW